MRARRAGPLAAGLLLASCATAPPIPSSPLTAECRGVFAAQDARIDAAGLRDGGAHRLPDFPYLRSDRFLASFAGSVDGDTRFATWVEALRQRDLAARSAELTNLDAGQAPTAIAEAAECGRRLAALELGRPDARPRVRAQSAVPDDYDEVARGLGLYPLGSAVLRLGVRGYQQDVRDDYARPLAALDAPGALALWTPEPRVGEFSQATGDFARDALGIPQPTPGQWQALLQRHAPSWWIEEAGAFDRPGAVRLGADARPQLEGDDPAVYYATGYTRFGRAVLPTLTYVAWFAERPARHVLDPYAGRLDGVVWRVVLDPRGEPLAYDSIHSCGCYRLHFPVQPLQPLPREGLWQEPSLMPQGAVAPGPVALRVQSATHFLRRVVPARLAQGREHRYHLVPYQALLSLPAADGSRRSAFGEGGLMPGTQRLERWWLWISGVRSPGQMRQQGRQATAFVGEQHFDDARFLEQVYALPAWARD